MHDIQGVLDTWKTNFSKLGTPKQSANYNAEDFDRVTSFVWGYNEVRDLDNSLVRPCSGNEVRVAIKSLRFKKALCHDGISAEHIAYTGDPMVYFLVQACNFIRVLEYIPECFRVGVQVPLFKGKDLPIHDPNTYSGITLLSTFNIFFEISIWQRLKGWWVQDIISELQGACNAGQCCLHTVFSLQETIVASMDDNYKCFVAFFDVDKAFDTVLLDGLFKQVHDLGITGRMWRLL